MTIPDVRTMDCRALDRLFDELRGRGYRLIGPAVRDGAIVYDEIASTRDLPVGWTDEQDAGRYRLMRSGDDQALFGYVVGPHSWKKFLFPPVQRLWQATFNGRELKINADDSPPPLQAFIAVRACELQAIAVQDQVFLGQACRDPVYQSRRERVFILAVNCTRPGGTCFCTSMGCGPKASHGYDLALTELTGDGPHLFTIEVGTELGAQVLDRVEHRPATAEEHQLAEELVRTAAERMGRTLDTAGIKELLYRSYEHPRWDEVAQRCLSCANCTMVCPTCFCSTVEDTTDLSGENAERWRKWDSCFNLDFSYIHGGSVRSSTRARYRQWMVHKLATWYDQFGSSGCVGCGRCITWCPVGIDITEELRAIRSSQAREDGHGEPATSAQ